MLIILAIFSLTQLVCSQFQEMVHGVFLASQSGSGPAGERRGLVSAQQPETSRGGGISFFWLTLIRFYWHLLVCVNAGITARAGAAFYHPQRIFPWAPGAGPLSRSLVTARCKSSRLMTLI